MEKICQQYSLKDLSRFVDHVVDPDESGRIKAHLEICSQCRCAVSHFRESSRAVANAIDSKVEQIDATDLEKRVYLKAYGKRDRLYKKLFDYFSLKFYLKVASVVAVAVIGLAYYTDTPVTMTTPSAIVKSIDGNMSSVMIFETQKTRHTIIWFSEI